MLLEPTPLFFAFATCLVRQACCHFMGLFFMMSFLYAAAFCSFIIGVFRQTAWLPVIGKQYGRAEEQLIRKQALNAGVDALRANGSR